ncbi:hypothetical protein [Microbacterium abyssi]|uniref:hypothetical protein n=1 Tax=Microbacterium abyssi TaxID=2782166 RepID=UPI0018882260|nr:hypothetical protein [Microbacterium sp. A18JL241]
MRDRKRLAGAVAAGVLCANSLPHLATAVTGHEHLTPLGGRHSSRWVNAVWGLMNLLGGLALVRGVASGRRRWDSRLVSFSAGAAVFAAWMAGSEAVLRTNSRSS